MLSKWRLVMWYWVAQAVFVSVVIPLGISQVGTVNGPRGQPWGEFDISELVRIAMRGEVAIGILATACLLMALQTVIVWPVRRPRVRMEKGWPLWLSIGVGAMAGAAIAVGIACAVGTILELVAPDFSHQTWDALWVSLWIWIGGSYIMAAALLSRFCSRGLRTGQRHETLLGRIAATLFVGTLVESAAIMPIDVMYRRKQDCYCSAGTFWGFVALIAAGLLTLGPAILLPLLSRRRKRWYASRCDCCGYDMTGLAGAERVVDRCPECGAGWKLDVEARV